MQRTKAALDQLDQAAFAHPAFFDNITVTGFDVQTGGQRSNAGVSFVLLKDWSERHEPELAADAVAGALMGAGAAIRDAFVFSLSPPAVEGMSNVGGLEGFVQSRSNDYAALEQVTQALIAAAARAPRVQERRWQLQRRHDVLGASAARQCRDRHRESQAAAREPR